MEQLRNTTATSTTSGLVRVSSASDATVPDGAALPTTEKNAAIAGTLANNIAGVSNRVSALENNRILHTSNGLLVKNSDYVADVFYQDWYKVGGIAFIHIAAEIVIPAAWQNYIIFTGAPLPYYPDWPFGVLQEQMSGLAYTANVDESGVIRVYSEERPQTTKTFFRGMFSYPYR